MKTQRQSPASPPQPPTSMPEAVAVPAESSPSVSPDEPGRSAVSAKATQRTSTDARIMERLKDVSARYILLGVWLVMAGIFGAVMPGKFLNTSTFQAIFGSQSTLLFIAAAALCTFVVGEFDLSFASVMGLSATLLPVLAGLHHINVMLACIISIVVAVTAGAINAFFIVVLNVSSLIVTLGSASLYLGLAELISSSNTVSVYSPKLSYIALHPVFGLPLSFYYGIALCAVFAYVLTWTPIGRHIIFVGANREVARLAGINVQRIRAMSYVSASFVAGLAGVLLVGTVGGFDSTASSTYLLPALAAVFLGTTIVLPGQFNPIGTLLGLYFLETGVIGLQLLGYTGWVQDAFYGAGLVIAVTVVTVVRRRSSTG